MKIGALQRKWILVKCRYRRKGFSMSLPLIRPQRVQTGKTPNSEKSPISICMLLDTEVN